MRHREGLAARLRLDCWHGGRSSPRPTTAPVRAVKYLLNYLLTHTVDYFREQIVRKVQDKSYTSASTKISVGKYESA